jgi:hypothetical protein
LASRMGHWWEKNEGWWGCRWIDEMSLEGRGKHQAKKWVNLAKRKRTTQTKILTIFWHPTNETNLTLHRQHGLPSLRGQNRNRIKQVCHREARSGEIVRTLRKLSKRKIKEWNQWISCF